MARVKNKTKLDTKKKTIDTKQLLGPFYYFFCVCFGQFEYIIIFSHLFIIARYVSVCVCVFISASFSLYFPTFSFATTCELCDGVVVHWNNVPSMIIFFWPIIHIYSNEVITFSRGGKNPLVGIMAIFSTYLYFNNIYVIIVHGSHLALVSVIFPSVKHIAQIAAAAATTTPKQN